jgi:YVTN family beta-propeller protein
MDFRILGPLEVHDGDRELSLGGRQQRALLALLLLHANEVVPVDQIVDELWREAPPTSATKSLQALVSRLRRTLEGQPSARNGDAGDNGVVLTRAHGYLLTIAPGELDRDRFESLLEAGRRALAAGHAKEASATLREALALWRGPPLAEFAQDAFAQVEIGKLDELRLSALEERIEADLVEGRAPELVAEVEALVAAHPLRERLRGQLMLALYQTGRQADALRVYQETRRLLVDELGIEPTPPLQRLERSILLQEKSLDAPESTRSPRVRTRSRLAVSAAAAIAVVTAGSLAIVLTRHDHRPPRVHVFSNSLVAIDQATNGVEAQVPVGARPASVAYGADALWVANLDDNSISRVDLRTRRVVRMIATDASPVGVAVGGRSVWVANGDAATVSRIDPRYDRVVKTIAIHGPTGFGLSAISYGLGSVWVAQSGGIVSRIDPRSGRLLATIVVGNDPKAIDVGAGAVWVANRWDGTVSRIDPTNVVTAEIPVGRGADAVAVGAGAVWVANGLENTVTRIDPTTNVITATATVGQQPGGIAVGAGAVWVTGSRDGTISKLDSRTGELVGTVRAGSSPSGVTAAAGRIWVTNEEGVADRAPVPTGTRGGVVRIDAENGFDYADPALAYHYTSWQLEYATCAKLLNYPDRPAPAGARLVPEVAQSLPLVSPDGKRYTFTIREGFRFSPPSNEAVTAQTLKYSIERSLSPKFRLAASFFDDIVGLAAYRTGKAQHISGVVAHGNLLTIDLLRRAGNLPSRLAMPWFCAVPVGTPVDPNGLRVIPSAGPYYVSSYTPKQQIVLRPNPNYRGPRPRRFDAIVYTLGVDKRRTIERSETGRADYGAEGVPPAAASELDAQYGKRSAAAKADRQRYFDEPLLGVAFLTLNTRRPLFSDVRLRRAVNYAIDRAALRRQPTMSSKGFGETTDQYLPRGMPGFRDVQIYPLRGPDVATARRLAAGRGGKAVMYACNHAPCPQQAQIVRANLKAIGIDVEVKPFPDAVLYDKTSKREEPFDITLGGWVVDYADPFDVLDYLFDGDRITAADNNNNSYLDDPEYNQKLAAAARLVRADRYRTYGALDVDIAQNAAPLVPFATYTGRGFFSARIGCQIYQPVYGFDLAALCLRR